MTYKLEFKESALKEWKKLGHTVKTQLKKKLKERLENPHIPSAALSGAKNIYKIKLRQLGYRLVYSVEDKTIRVGKIITCHCAGTQSIGCKKPNQLSPAFQQLRNQP